MTPDGTFQAEVGDRTFDLNFDDGELTLDGESVAYTFEPLPAGGYVLIVDGRTYPVVIEPQSDDTLRVSVNGRARTVRVKDEHDLLLERFGLKEALAAGQRAVRAPMPGLVLDVHVESGQEVEAGTPLLVLEAMKMENELRAEAAGTVQTIHVEAGDAVDKNALLLELEG